MSEALSKINPTVRVEKSKKSPQNPGREGVYKENSDFLRKKTNRKNVVYNLIPPFLLSRPPHRNHNSLRLPTSYPLPVRVRSQRFEKSNISNRPCPVETKVCCTNICRHSSILSRLMKCHLWSSFTHTHTHTHTMCVLSWRSCSCLCHRQSFVCSVSSTSISIMGHRDIHDRCSWRNRVLFTP